MELKIKIPNNINQRHEVKQVTVLSYKWNFTDYCDLCVSSGVMRTVKSMMSVTIG